MKAFAASAFAITLVVVCAVFFFANYASIKVSERVLRKVCSGLKCYQRCCRNMSGERCLPEDETWTTHSPYYVTRNLTLRQLCGGRRPFRIMDEFVVGRGGDLRIESMNVTLRSHQYCRLSEEAFVACETAESQDVEVTEEAKTAATFSKYIVENVLIISTVSYFVSAGCYLFFLKVKDIHRKCFVAYSISMGLTFLFLVLLQQWQAKCYTLGFFFFLFIMNGFLWLTILCVDLALELWYFERSAAKERWFWYIGACLTVPPFILFASVIPDWVPDIPDTFIINFGNDVESMCSFKESTNYFFFLPIGIMMGISLAALCTSVHAIRVNNKNFSNHFPWLDTRGSYKYIFRSCLLMWILSTVWMVESAVRLRFPGVQKLALFLIESSLGIFTMLVFVLNRYTRKEMMQRFHRKSRKESPMEMITNLLEVKEAKSGGEPEER